MKIVVPISAFGLSKFELFWQWCWLSVNILAVALGLAIGLSRWNLLNAAWVVWYGRDLWQHYAWQRIIKRLSEDRQESAA